MLQVPQGAKVYISGPIEGKDGRNAESFDAAVSLLTKWGYRIVNPLDNFGGTGHLRKRSENMSADFKSVISCDAIYLLKGYHKSPGCQDEIRTAVTCAKPIFYEEGC